MELDFFITIQNPSPDLPLTDKTKVIIYGNETLIVSVSSDDNNDAADNAQYPNIM
jgi:hypothetical protein